VLGISDGQRCYYDLARHSVTDKRAFLSLSFFRLARKMVILAAAGSAGCSEHDPYWWLSRIISSYYYIAVRSRVFIAE